MLRTETQFRFSPPDSARIARDLRDKAGKDPAWQKTLEGVLGPYSPLEKESPWRDVYTAAAAKNPPIWIRDPEAAALTTTGFRNEQVKINQDKIREWSMSAKGDDILHLYNYLNSKNTFEPREAVAFAELAVKAGKDLDLVARKLETAGYKFYDEGNLVLHSLGGDVFSAVSPPTMPDFISFAKYKNIFATMTAETKKNNREYASTGWIVQGEGLEKGKIIFAQLIAGDEHSVHPDLNTKPKRLANVASDRVKPAFVLHTHPPGGADKFHFSEADFQSLLNGSYKALAMLTTDGSALFGFAGEAAASRKFLDLMLPGSLPSIQSIFDKHLPEHMPNFLLSTMAGLARAAREVCETYGITFYMLRPESNIAECLYKAD